MRIIVKGQLLNVSHRNRVRYRSAKHFFFQHKNMSNENENDNFNPEEDANDNEDVGYDEDDDENANQENADVQDSLYPNLSLWRVIPNESSYGKIGLVEGGNKQISIFLQIFGNGKIK